MSRDQPLRPGALPGLLGYRLRLAQQAVFRDFAASVGEISPGRLGILLLVEANPGVTQSRLARALRAIERHERRIATRLSAAERRQLLALLGKISG